MSMQEFFYKGFQRSIPSSTAIYLVESSNNRQFCRKSVNVQFMEVMFCYLRAQNCYLHIKSLVLTSVQGSSCENEEFCITCIASHTHAVAFHYTKMPYDQDIQNLV